MSCWLQASRGRGIVAGLLLGGVLALTACAGGSSSGNGGSTTTGGAPTATPAATATPKPLASHPNITVAYCKQLLSLSAANQIIPSSSPATTITQGNPNDAESGACNYVISPGHVLLIIYFIPYSGPQPVTQQDIAALLSQASGSNVTVNTASPVNGIGLQAEYVDATGHDPNSGGSASVHILYVLEGPYIFDCVTYEFLSPILATQSQLQQCATAVDSVLRQ
ncbi:MAG TPA: hypothetical protein VIC85_08365 [Ktedonobacterales bacterium]